MVGWKEAGVLGAAAAAGAIAFLAWKYASSSGQEAEPRAAGEAAADLGHGGERKEAQQEENSGGRTTRRRRGTTEEATARQSVATSASARVAASPAPKASTSRGTQVLVLGLDGAGKTSLLHCLATGNLEQDMQPTQGFNAVSINREDLHIEFLEIGGKEELRPYWQKYLSRALVLVFVVDSSEPQLFAVAKKHLHELLAPDTCLPLMVLANKQDLPGACSITDLHDALGLSEVGDRRLFLIGTHAKKVEAELSSGVQDARDLIVQMVRDGR